MNVLIIENISKEYRQIKAVDNVNLTLKAGERLALLGHNGAGKTSLIKIILGLVAPTSGTIRVLGKKPGAKKARLYSGYLPENVAFHGSLSAREQMHYFASLKSVDKREADKILERVGLAKAMDRRIGTYSKGMRQRVGLAQALLGKPKLILLDEPTSGLDPISRHDFYDIIGELANNGTAVLISSHALTEMETKMDKIAIMAKGKLVANDSLENLRKKANLPIKINILANEKSVKEVAGFLNAKQVNGHRVELFCQKKDKIKTLGKISKMSGKISDIDISAASLEELYRFFSTPIEKQIKPDNREQNNV